MINIKGNLINLDTVNFNNRIYSKNVVSNYIKRCSDNSNSCMIPIIEFCGWNNMKCTGPVIGYCKIFIEDNILKFEGKACFDKDDVKCRFLTIACICESELCNSDNQSIEYVTSIDDYSIHAYFYSDSAFYSTSNIEICE